MKRTILYLLIPILVFLIIFAIPLSFNWTTLNPWLLTGQVGTSTWLSFLGSYSGGIIGGLIGGLVTIIGIRLTLNNEKKKEENNKQLEINRQIRSVRPYLLVETIDKESLSPFIQLEGPHMSFINLLDRSVDVSQAYLLFSNIGLAAAVNIRISFRGLCDETAREFCIPTNSNISRCVSFSGSLISERSSHCLDIIYEDILGDKYKQLIYFKVNCDLITTEGISSPELIEKDF